MPLNGLKVLKPVTPAPSIDGVRVYKHHSEPLETSKLEAIFEDWAWTEGLPALADKMVEEANEMAEGDHLPPVKTRDTWEFVGTSASSEALTCGIVALKYLYMQGVPVDDALNLMFERHLEQMDRYNANN